MTGDATYICIGAIELPHERVILHHGEDDFLTSMARERCIVARKGTKLRSVVDAWRGCLPFLATLASFLSGTRAVYIPEICRGTKEIFLPRFSLEKVDEE